jgi:hypothetical protein
MEYYDEEYLKLFKKIKEEKQDYTFEQLRGNANNLNAPMLKETPNYNSYYNQNINEVQRNNYSQDLNLNEFNIETRINGQSINGQNVQNLNEVVRSKQDKEDKLNEVMEHLRQERLNEVKKTQEMQSLNEVVNFKDVDVVTLEMFEKARVNFGMTLANRLLPK